MKEKEDEEPSPAGLRPGMVVKDKAGTRKVVIRIGVDTVFWRYLDKTVEPELREHGTPYPEFEDTHFVTAETAPISNAA
jgi:hypothetical protein